MGMSAFMGWIRSRILRLDPNYLGREFGAQLHPKGHAVGCVGTGGTPRSPPSLSLAQAFLPCPAYPLSHIEIARSDPGLDSPDRSAWHWGVGVGGAVLEVAHDVRAPGSRAQPEGFRRDSGGGSGAVSLPTGIGARRKAFGSSWGLGSGVSTPIQGVGGAVSGAPGRYAALVSQVLSSLRQPVR